jgi:hypothetical protein
VEEGREVTAEHLRGPWAAFLCDSSGFIYTSAEDLRENAEDPEGEDFEISVRRETAAAAKPAGCRDRLPGTCHSGDIAYELSDVWLDDEDPSVGVEARYAQAQAMAAGLNAAAVAE